jgi:hypothetical protein
VPNFRDAGRALRLADGNWYVGVGSDAGSSLGAACNGSLPRNMTTDGPAALRLYRATNDSLSEFTALGLAHVENFTLGFVRSSSAEWTPTPWANPPFMECPDVFSVLGGKRQVFIASYGDVFSRTFQSSEWRVGTLAPSGGFTTMRSGVLDYGAYYASKTSGDSRPDAADSGRRVIHAFTGWTERAGSLFGRGCGQRHLLPRDIWVDSTDRLRIAPISERAALRVGGAAPPQALVANGPAVALGSVCEITVRCTAKTSGADGVVSASGVVGGAWVGVDIGLDAVAGQWTRIGYDWRSRKLFVNQSRTDITQPLNFTATFQQTDDMMTITGSAPIAVNLTIIVDGALLASPDPCHS